MAGLRINVDDRGHEFHKAGRLPTLEEVGMPARPTVARELLSMGASVLVIVSILLFVTATLVIGVVALFVGGILSALLAVTFFVLLVIGVVRIPLIMRPRKPRAHRGCPNCGYVLEGLTPASDGCTLCPECGAAWKLGPREPNNQEQGDT